MEKASISPWISSDLSLWEKLIADEKPIFFKKNSIIYTIRQPEDDFYIVVRGRVRVTIYSESGVEKQLLIAEKGAVFGELAYASKMAYYCSAVAIVDSYVYRIGKEKADRIIAGDPQFLKRFLASIAIKALTYQDQILELSLSSSEQRVAQILINLCEQYGKKTKYKGRSGVLINIKFTHQDVANIISASRVTVSTIFSNFIKQGVLRKIEGYYVIFDLEFLKDVIRTREFSVIDN